MKSIQFRIVLLNLEHNELDQGIKISHNLKGQISMMLEKRTLVTYQVLKGCRF